MAFNIDLDRGVITCKDPGTGMDVHMYVDQPGVYLNSHGGVLPEELARRSGFEVERYAKDRRRQVALSVARERALAELDEADKSGEKIVVAEREGYRVIDLGYDRYKVLDPDGDALTPGPLGKHEAVLLLDALVPAPAVTEAEKQPEEDTK